MKEKLNIHQEHKIKQNRWPDSPCSSCYGSPCCTVVPLTGLRLDSRTDFINLALLACYRNIRLCLKTTGEWSVYLDSFCKYLDPETTKCRIHSKTNQSLICKSYDAQKCWYKPAFKNNQNEEAIFFDLNRLIFLEKYTDFLNKGRIHNEVNWDELVKYISDIPLQMNDRISGIRKIHSDHLLSFKSCKAENVLFFPPFEKPSRNIHFELAIFRLGFPGINLAITDNYWSYVVSTEVEHDNLEKIKKEYFPSIKTDDCGFSFNMLNKVKWFHSKIGDKWVVAELEHIRPLKGLMKYDYFGNITKIPSTMEILALFKTLRPEKPDKAA
jgi:hypothetical protein